jgi:arylesterase/paraoxonase
MARAGLTFFALLAILIAVYFEFSLKARLSAFGVWRKLEPVGNTNCNKVETLQACESVSRPNDSSGLTIAHYFLLSAEIVLHSPSGLLYLACSTQAKRQHWLPALGVLEDDKVSSNDYIATYDPATDTVTRLTFSGFPTSQGYSSHGLDVVPSAANPRELFVYAINHRKPVHGQGKLVGADSVVEIFKTTVGGNTLAHVRTIESPIINTPNDLVGSSDGRSFYFTNDHGVKVGFVRRPDSGWYMWRNSFLDQVARVLGVSTDFGWVLPRRRGVQDCDSWFAWKQWHRAGTKRYRLYCQFQIWSDPRPRGAKRPLPCIVRYYRVGCVRQPAMGVILKPFLAADRLLDNLSIDTNEALWAAGFPHVLAVISAHHNLEKVAPSSAFRITKNVGNKAFFGEKLKVEKVRGRALRCKRG